MDTSVSLVLIGGLISLVSTLAGIALQHWFEQQKQEHEMRRYPIKVLFNKQIEFYEKVANILPKLNGYITTVSVWLFETGSDAQRNVNEFAEKTGSIWEFKELIETYLMYLPEKILRAGDDLFAECLFLSNSPAIQRAERAIGLFSSFQNTIRECIGTNRISDDLLKVFSPRSQTKEKAQTER